MNRKKSGIYCIKNLVNGKKYIGQTTNFKKRMNYHFRYLDGNYHDNQHLQNAYNKYGKNSFIFEILIYCEKFELTRYEQFFVDQENKGNLYNIRTKCVDSNLGVPCSKETKNILSKKAKQRLKNPENNGMYGKHHTKASREKISMNHADVSGKNHPLWGKRHSKETRRKMSENHADFSGKNSAKYGKPVSKETRQKMSGAKIGEKSYTSKLNEDEVFRILHLYYQENIIQKEIAKRYDVSIGAISAICHGKNWNYCYKKFTQDNYQIIKEKDNFRNNGENNPSSKLTKKQVFEILNLHYKNNATQIDISKDFGVSKFTIWNICHGKTWNTCYKEFMKEFKNE